ncbi:MAG: hypothetical protein EOO63_13790 [Hymenobacter sp.]|nr:MAG: hypothetical protein EOO63_13790 [Hymenobacter sp.]
MACTYKNNESDIPAPTCKVPTTVSSQTNVWPILKNNCRDACHNPTTAAAYANFNMDKFDDVQHYAVTPPNYGGLTSPYLLGNIRHEAGYVAMPQGRNKLSDCDIAIIEAWVKAGALNN